ncbi:MAG: hypothetical protein K2G20_06325, partial [Lachnospiraceae bacterium]|nr:hypothetical protein [Lachnospiraceae bacterium]
GYRTIAEEWNAEAAAERLLTVLEGLLSGRVEFAKNGVLSRAPVISPNRMYRHLTAGEGSDL